jgi:hypothetical protein
MSSLTSDGKPAPVPEPTIATEVHEALDVHSDLSPEVSFNLEVLVDALSDLTDVSVVELLCPLVLGEPSHLTNLRRAMRADAINILKGDHEMLTPGKIYA